ncbi:outer membrane beta-barrel protein [Bacteroides cellulosilyticus]|jgi:hypothetical protein|uniref:outer membrane beta-barrel protein n=1 Tax=Bacteroides cellulosilyticus TaxID=246787 RepID=UPI001896B50C|nr:outer membrane beta-barrel protein [Bacteroides cellulosilyticus]
MNVHKIWLLLLFLLIPTILFAQKTRTVKGLVCTTSETKKGEEPLPYASLVILEGKDSTFVKGVASDADGRFNLQFTPQKGTQYLLKASYTGMQSVFRKLDSNASTINLGSILLEEGIELGEVTVNARMRDVDQVGDTTVINAAAYKTPEGSYLETLVKRIPGMEYDSETKTLKYNGLPINEINVNGEAFFSGDNKMALENLPVELISKIKVYDKKSKQEKLTGVSTGKENYVLDLQTKEEFNGTLLVSGQAGYGNNNKKDFNLQGNYFKNNGNNFSVIANSGNLHMRTSYKDNIQENVAVNFTQKYNKKLTLNGNVSYHHNEQGNVSTSYNEQYLTSGNKYQYSAGNNTNRSRNMNSSLGLNWQVDTLTFVNFFGNFNLVRNNNANNNRQATFNENPHLDILDPFSHINDVPDELRINDIAMGSLMQGEQHRYSFHANIIRRINKKGSSIGLTAQYNDSKNDNNNFSISSTTYYQLKNSAGNDSILYRNQYSSNLSPNRQQGIGLMFSHPFSKKLHAQISYNLNYSKQKNDRNTYDLSGFMEETAVQPGYLPEGYEASYIDSLSNRSHSSTLQHGINLHFNYSDTIWNINAGVSVQPERRSLNQKTGLHRADTTLHSVGFQPMLFISWQKKKNRITLNYYGNTWQPSLYDLISPTNNSDPLNITRSNPNLKPTYNQSVRLEAQNTKEGLFATLNWNNRINSQTRAVIYNQQTGGRETYPVNINGNWNISGVFRYQKRIKDFNLSANAGGSFAQDVNLINENQSEQPERSATHNTGLNSDLRLSYQPKWGNLDLNGRWNFQHSSNSLLETDTYTRNYTFGLNGFADLPGGIQLRTDANYSFRNGTNIKKGEDDQIVWNASITWRFLKKKQAEISANWVDILSQQKNYFRGTMADGLYENHTQQIGSYFIVSVKYRFNQPLHK